MAEELRKTDSVPPVTACINVFQDVDLLEKCLLSLVGKVETIVVVDGAYEGFPHEKPYSTDGTIDLAEEYADVVIICEDAWPNEIVKRNSYLPHIPEGRWWLRIDADEQLIGGIAPRLHGIAYRLLLVRSEGPQYPILALYRKGKTSRHFGAHHAVWWENTLLIKMQDDLPLLQDARLFHDVSTRELERVEAKGMYYRGALMDNEREFRREFGI